MLVTSASGLCRLAATTLFILYIAGCSEDSEPRDILPSDNGTDTSTNEDGATLVGPYDGTYTVSFISNGIQAALGVLHVENSEFDGDLANIFSEVFTVTGYILSLIHI